MNKDKLRCSPWNLAAGEAAVPLKIIFSPDKMNAALKGKDMKGFGTHEYSCL
jgi:hypothetical protein